MDKKVLFFTFLIVMVVGSLTIKVITLPPYIKTPKLVEIPENVTAEQIAEILKKENVIKNERWFLWFVKHYNLQNKLQAGIYEFYGRVPLRKVINKLASGKVVLVKITIPEGATVKDIGKILEEKNITSKEEFVNYCLKNKLEGFLFPDTYLFPMKISPQTVARIMVKKFWEEFEKIYEKEISKKNEKEIKRIVIVASIVEKEAEIDSERPIVASVIYNRLKKNLPLQSCATVEYALGYHKSRLSEKEISINSPFNTYIHKGLPPTPICNPGIKSLKAAIKPARTDYLYFVSKGNGRHYFSKTYKEHLQARKIYLENSEKN